MLLQYDPNHEKEFETTIIEKWRNRNVVGGFLNDRNVAMALEVAKNILEPKYEDFNWVLDWSWTLQIILKVFNNLIRDMPVSEIEDYVTKLINLVPDFYEQYHINDVFKRNDKNFIANLRSEAYNIPVFIEWFRYEHKVFL